MSALKSALALGVAALGALLAPQQGRDDWKHDFAVQPADLTTTGRNQFFILEPGYTLVLDGGGTHLVITVLADTKRVGGVDTRVVEERETEDGELVEVSRNYFAIDKRTNDVYYFGEDVDIYKKGKIVSHEGAWLAGQKGAQFGLAMPASPALKARYYQEYAPGVAMDRAEIVSLNDSLTTPAGKLTGLLRVLETTPLERGEREYKLYAPGIGLVKDEDAKLVSHGLKR